MKRLLAMLLALCMMCGLVAAEAEDTQTIPAILAEFQVPADWALDITQDEAHSFIAFATLPDGREAYITMRKAEYFEDCTSQKECFERIYMGNHGLEELGNITITEGYEYMMPDGEPLIIGNSLDGRYSFAHRYSDVVMYLQIGLGEGFTAGAAQSTALSIFASVTNPAIEANRVTPMNEVADGKRSIRLGKATFEVDADLVATQESDTVFAAENDRYTMSLMCVDWNAMGIDINLTGDEQMDNAFYCSLLVFDDQELAAAIAAQSMHADCSMPDGSDVMILPTDGFLMLTHYYKETGFLLLLESKDEAYNSKLMEVAAAVAVSFRIDGVSDEEMAADAEAARIAAEEAAAKAAAQKYIVIKNSTANIRSGPSSDYDRITTAYKGDTFPLLGEEGTWYKIEVNGQTAYVSKGLCEISE